jgi:hypothetical protein
MEGNPACASVTEYVIAMKIYIDYVSIKRKWMADFYKHGLLGRRQGRREAGVIPGTPHARRDY